MYWVRVKIIQTKISVFTLILNITEEELSTELQRSDYRVVTGSDVRVRDSASITAEILEELPKGRLVLLLSKGWSWSYVEVANINETKIIQG